MGAMDFLFQKKDEKTEKLLGELESLKLRKESVLSVIQNEISELERQKNTIWTNGGKLIYETWKKNETVEENVINEYWNKVSSIETEIQGKLDKKAEMEQRYDEEITLLQRNLAPAPATPAAPATSATPAANVCPNCGHTVKPNSAFCTNCGTKLQQ